MGSTAQYPGMEVFSVITRYLPDHTNLVVATPKVHARLCVAAVAGGAGW
jgi:hypothetical protein